MHVRITVLNGRHRSRGGISESLGLPLVAPTAVIAVAVPLAFRGEVELGKELLELFTDLWIILVGGRVHRRRRARVEDLVAVAPRVARVKVPLAEDARLAVADGGSAVGGGLEIDAGGIPVNPLVLRPPHVQPPPGGDLGVAQDGLGPQVPLPAPLQVVPLHGDAVHPRGDLAVGTADPNKRHFATKTFLAKVPRIQRKMNHAENVGAMMKIILEQTMAMASLGPPMTSEAVHAVGLPAAGMCEPAQACPSARMQGLANVRRVDEGRPWIFAGPKSQRNRPKIGLERG